MLTIPELSRQGEKHTSHCSLFIGCLGGKTSGEARVERRNEALSARPGLSYRMV